MACCSGLVRIFDADDGVRLAAWDLGAPLFARPVVFVDGAAAVLLCGARDETLRAVGVAFSRRPVRTGRVRRRVGGKAL